MNELTERQFAVMREIINSYRNKRLGLNTLIQKILGIGEIINDNQWKEGVFPFVLEMEQINADVINSGEDLTEKDKVELEKYIVGIEELIAGFEIKNE